MFAGLPSSGSKLRYYRSIVASVAVHLAILASIVFHRPRAVEMVPTWLAYGDSDHNYRVTYFPADAPQETSEEKLILAHKTRAVRTPAHASPSPKRTVKPEQARLDADASDHNARAGSPLGTLIDGPIAGHEVHVAYPIVFPDPPVARSQLPPGLAGDVIIEVTIDSTGNVVETRILEAIGHGIDEKIVATLRQWHYQPATLDGIPVASRHDVHFHFPS